MFLSFIYFDLMNELNWKRGMFPFASVDLGAFHQPREPAKPSMYQGCTYCNGRILLATTSPYI